MSDQDGVEKACPGAEGIAAATTIPSEIIIEDLVQATVRAMVLHQQATSPRLDPGNVSGAATQEAPSKKPFTNAEIAALLPEFTGLTQDIDLWLKRVTAIQSVYSIPDDVMQIISVGKLTSQAKQWFQSKVQFIIMAWRSLKKEMRKMYEHRADTVTLRKQFEKRRWKPNERFATYYHDKVTLL